MKLSFRCDQQLEDFISSKKGYHCTLCKKNLVDFRNQSENTIRVYHSNHPNTCGVYDLKTIDKSIITRINFNFLYKPVFVISTALSFFYTRETNAQSPPIEIVEKDSTNSVSIEISPKEETLSSRVLTKQKRKDSRIWKRISKRRQRSWYLTWRFPFLKKSTRQCEAGFW